MIRFFAKPNNITATEVRLTAEDLEHMRVCRLRPNELFVVCDGNETDYMCSLSDNLPEKSSRDSEVVVQILSRKKTHTEPSVKCTLYTAYTKGDRLDYTVQKAVELGVYKIAFFNSERCVAKPRHPGKKAERLRKVSLEAAKQSGRGIIPEVISVGDFHNALEAAVRDEDIAILCYEEEKNLHLKTVLNHYFPTKPIAIREPVRKTTSVALITGPEGGFEDSEIKLAQSMDISVVTMGSRILRSETAPVVALSAIMYHTENL